MLLIKTGISWVFDYLRNWSKDQEKKLDLWN